MAPNLNGGAGVDGSVLAPRWRACLCSVSSGSSKLSGPGRGRGRAGTARDRHRGCDVFCVCCVGGRGRLEFREHVNTCSCPLVHRLSMRCVLRHVLRNKRKMLCDRRCLFSELLQQHAQTVESESFSFSHSATLRWHKKIGQITDNGSNSFADNPLPPDQSDRVTQDGLLLPLSWLCLLGLWESSRAWFYGGLPLGEDRGRNSPTREDKEN